MFKPLSVSLVLSIGLTSLALADEAASKPCLSGGAGVLSSQTEAVSKDAAQIAAAGGSYAFTGSTAYYSGPALADMSPDFNPPDPKHPEQTNGSLRLVTSGDATSGGSATPQLVGVTEHGSTLTILAQQSAQPCPWGEGLCAKVDGIVNISSQEIEAAGLKDVGAALAMGFSLQISGAEISGGYADLCLTRDSAKNCHGIQLQFIPH